MAATRKDLYVEAGADLQFYFFMLDPNGDPVTLAGTSFEGQIRKTKLSQAILGEFTFQIFDITTDMAAEWNITYVGPAVLVSIPAEVTALVAAMPEENHCGFYDILWLQGDSTQRMLEGEVYISEGVTR